MTLNPSTETLGGGPVAGRVTDLDGRLIVVGSGGGSIASGTEYTEDAASAANPVGGLLIVRRRDVLTGSEVSADGDNIALNSTSKGELYIKQTDAVPITDNGGSLTVDGTVAATQSGTWNVGTLTGITNVVHVDDNASTISVDDGAGSLTVDGTVTANLAAGTNNIGDVDVLTLPALPAGNNNIGDVDVASSVLLTGASTAAKQPALGTAGTASTDVLSVQGIASMTALKTDSSATTQPVSGTVTANPTFPSSAAVAQVASSASSVTLQASNSARRGLAISNDSTAVLYVKFGTTASTTSYTVKMAAGAYYEVPQPCYTGRVDGIWSAANGNAYVTEIS